MNRTILLLIVASCSLSCRRTPPHLMHRAVHCQTLSADGYRVSFELATNDVGDQLEQIAYTRPAESLPFASTAAIWSGALTNPNTPNILVAAQPGWSGDGRLLLSAYEDIGRLVLRSAQQQLDGLSTTKVATSLPGECTKITDGSLPRDGNQTITFGRIVAQAACCGTWDATAGNYVDLDYRVAFDAQGNALAMGAVAARLLGGQQSAMASTTSSNTSAANLALAINLGVISKNTVGTWTMAMDPVSNAWTAIYDDAAMKPCSKMVKAGTCAKWYVPRSAMVAHDPR